MIFLFNVLKCLLKNILLFWYPFGRLGVKEFRCFFCTVLLLVLLPLVLPEKLNAWFPNSEFFRLCLDVVDYICEQYLILILLLICSIYSAFIRRGHDLGHSTFFTVTHFFSWSGYGWELLSQPGQPNANEYGPASEENRRS